MIHELNKNTSIVNKFLAQLRSTAIQKDSMRFRNNLERIGQVFAYEISKKLNYKDIEVDTPMGSAQCKVLSDNIVVASIMRAGIPMHNGILSFFDDAQNAFIGAYRLHHKDGTFDISLEYVTAPNLDGKVVILADPMLATGASIAKTIEKLKEHGKWSELHIVSVVAATQGIEHVKRLYKKAHIWTVAIDDELTAKSYIVPGLGDAGDLAFGEKD
jgi:uracil phosphoribosyltransferase